VTCADNLEAEISYDFGIFSADGDILYGGISINPINREHNFANVGYWVRLSQQRRGIASCAVRRIAEYGFEHLELTRLEILAEPENLASCRVAEKSGALFEGIARNRLMVNDRLRNAAVYGLIPSDLLRK
jgi:RimJ/RimL family protein N-acetyltransferase